MLGSTVYDVEGVKRNLLLEEIRTGGFNDLIVLELVEQKKRKGG